MDHVTSYLFVEIIAGNASWLLSREYYVMLAHNPKHF